MCLHVYAQIAMDNFPYLSQHFDNPGILWSHRLVRPNGQLYQGDVIGLITSKLVDSREDVDEDLFGIGVTQLPVLNQYWYDQIHEGGGPQRRLRIGPEEASH